MIAIDVAPSSGNRILKLDVVTDNRVDGGGSGGWVRGKHGCVDGDDVASGIRGIHVRACAKISWAESTGTLLIDVSVADIITPLVGGGREEGDTGENNWLLGNNDLST